MEEGWNMGRVDQSLYRGCLETWDVVFSRPVHHLPGKATHGERNGRAVDVWRLPSQSRVVGAKNSIYHTAVLPPFTSLHRDPTSNHSRHCHEPFLPACHPCLPCPAPRRHRWAERCVPADCMHAAQHSAAQSIYLLPRRRAGRVGL